MIRLDKFPLKVGDVILRSDKDGLCKVERIQTITSKKKITKKTGFFKRELVRVDEIEYVERVWFRPYLNPRYEISLKSYLQDEFVRYEEWMDMRQQARLLMKQALEAVKEIE